MAKQAELAREMITTKLEKGEQLRSVCSFRAVPFWAWMLLGNLFLLFGKRNYYIGVTNKRLIIVPLNKLAKPIDKDIYSVPLTDVELKGKALLVKLPDKEKPKKYYMYTGLQRITGFDADEFKAVLNADEKFGPNLVGGVCPDCGHKNRADAQFCEECGANIKGVVKKSELPKETSKKPGLPLALRIAIVVFGLIGLIIGALCLLGNLFDDVGTKSSDKYLDELTEKAEKCSTSLTSVQALIEEGSVDDTIYSDNEWIAENNAALDLMEEYCTTFGWDNDVSEEFETTNDLLLQSRSEYSEFIRLYRVGLSEMDEEKFIQATDHVLRAADFTNQAYEALP